MSINQPTDVSNPGRRVPIQNLELIKDEGVVELCCIPPILLGICIEISYPIASAILKQNMPGYLLPDAFASSISNINTSFSSFSVLSV